MTAIRGVWGAVQDDGTTPYRNHAEDIRAAVWDQLGRRQGVIDGFDMTLDSGSLSVTFAAGSALIEERGTDINGDARGYHVFNDVTTQVSFDAPDASSRNDAVVFAWADPQYGALGASVSGEGPQIVIVKGTSGSTTPRTDTQINDEIGVGGWFRYADVVIDNGDTEVDPANVTSFEAELSLATPAAVLTRTGSSQSILDNSETDIAFDTVAQKQGNISADVANNIVVGEDGFYHIAVTGGMSGSGGGIRRTVIRDGGGTTLAWQSDSGTANNGTRAFSAATVVFLTAGETIKASIFQNSGAAVDLQVFGATPRLSVVKVA